MMADLTLKIIHNDITETFRCADIPQARQEARYLIEAILGLSKTDFMDAEQVMLTTAQAETLNNATEKRCNGMPLSKITGRKGFWTHDFVTSENVLDPRPDTEILIESVLAYIDQSDLGRGHAWRLLDLGTGSGCIALTLLSELPNAHITAIDISADALRVAQKNAEKLALSSRVTFIQGHWCAPLLAQADNPNAEMPQFDIVVSNPPYIPSADIEGLMPEVRQYDPILALDGGDDGMDCYDDILKSIPPLIHPQSLIFVEIGTNQTEQIKRIVKNRGFALCDIQKDLGGINRVVSMALGAS